MDIKVSILDINGQTHKAEGGLIWKNLTGSHIPIYCRLYGCSPLPCSPPPAAASAAPRRGERVFVGQRRGGRGPGLAKDPKEAPGPRLDGVGVHSDSNGYGSDIEEGVCSERRRGAKKPHHGLQVDITTSRPNGWFISPLHAAHFIMVAVSQ